MTPDEILEAIITHHAEQASENVKMQVRLQYEPLRHALLDYIGGLTTAEVIKKHKFALTTFQRHCEDLGVRSIDYKRQPKSLARKIAHRTGNEARLQELKECNCRTCAWVLARVEKIKRGEILE